MPSAQHDFIPLRRCRMALLAAVLLLTAVSHVWGDALQPIPLWPDAPDNAQAGRGVESELEFGDQRVVRNVTQPVLLPFPASPGLNTGVAVIVAPGGGFKFLSIDREGTLVAQWLNARGVNAFVLKYHLDDTGDGKLGFYWRVVRMFAGFGLKARSPDEAGIAGSALTPVQSAAIDDGLRAIALVRERAGEWSVRPDAIGILGFSAGGLVANGAAMRGHGASRPDFAAAVYGLPLTDAIPENAPPLLLVTADDDPIVPAQWSQALHDRWRAAGYDSTLIRYSDGGHGFGMLQEGTSSDEWINGFYDWLSRIAFDGRRGEAPQGSEG